MKNEKCRVQNGERAHGSRYRNRHFAFCILHFAFCLLLLAHSAAAAESPVVPTPWDWPAASPESQAMSTARLGPAWAGLNSRRTTALLMGAFSESHDAPYPPSPVIKAIRWAPKETVVRKAQDSDNWPITWADDDGLYTAYGDGCGFDPKIPEKLSLGFAKVIGGPDDFSGINIRSATGEQKGNGVKGKKASGMLMAGGVLYLWVSNAGNSQLAWSSDHGKTWRWCGWKFTASFGCPTFLNFGRNYAGARDDFVYIYSPDSDSAYDAADVWSWRESPRTGSPSGMPTSSSRAGTNRAVRSGPATSPSGRPSFAMRGNATARGSATMRGCGATSGARPCPAGMPGSGAALASTTPPSPGDRGPRCTHRTMGRGPGGIEQLPDEMDQRRREDRVFGVLR